jgi:hypothetical protein
MSKSLDTLWNISSAMLQALNVDITFIGLNEEGTLKVKTERQEEGKWKRKKKAAKRTTDV